MNIKELMTQEEYFNKLGLSASVDMSPLGLYLYEFSFPGNIKVKIENVYNQTYLIISDKGENIKREIQSLEELHKELDSLYERSIKEEEELIKKNMPKKTKEQLDREFNPFFVGIIEKGQTYYDVRGYQIEERVWKENEFDKELFKNNNFFTEKTEAEECLRNMIENFQPEKGENVYYRSINGDIVPRVWDGNEKDISLAQKYRMFPTPQTVTVGLIDLKEGKNYYYVDKDYKIKSFTYDENEEKRIAFETYEKAQEALYEEMQNWKPLEGQEYYSYKENELKKRNFINQSNKQDIAYYPNENVAEFMRAQERRKGLSKIVLNEEGKFITEEKTENKQNVENQKEVNPDKENIEENIGEKILTAASTISKHDPKVIKEINKAIRKAQENENDKATTFAIYEKTINVFNDWGRWYQQKRENVKNVLAKIPSYYDENKEKFENFTHDVKVRAEELRNELTDYLHTKEQDFKLSVKEGKEKIKEEAKEFWKTKGRAIAATGLGICCVFTLVTCNVDRTWLPPTNPGPYHITVEPNKDNDNDKIQLEQGIPETDSIDYSKMEDKVGYVTTGKDYEGKIKETVEANENKAPEVGKNEVIGNEGPIYTVNGPVEGVYEEEIIGTVNKNLEEAQKKAETSLKEIEKILQDNSWIEREQKDELERLKADLKADLEKAESQEEVEKVVNGLHALKGTIDKKIVEHQKQVEEGQRETLYRAKEAVQTIEANINLENVNMTQEEIDDARNLMNQMIEAINNKDYSKMSESLDYFENVIEKTLVVDKDGNVIEGKTPQIENNPEQDKSWAEGLTRDEIIDMMTQLGKSEEEMKQILEEYDKIQEQERVER